MNTMCHRLTRCIPLLLLVGLLLAACTGSKTTLADIQALKAGMTPEEVVEQLGKPQRTTGFGVQLDVYDLDDGTYVMLGYGPQRDRLRSIRWVHKDGTYEDILSPVVTPTPG